MSDFRTQLKCGLKAGVKKGWSSFVWICKIIVPVSFFVALLQWSGWLDQLDFLLTPLMGLLNLPAEAALPIVIGMLVGPPAVIAIITVIPFTIGQMTLIAIFTLIAHMLITEGIIQSKSGINIIKITVVRIAVAILTVLIVSQFLGDTSQSIIVPANLMVHIPFTDALKSWIIDLIRLSIKVFAIIMIVMTILECLRSLGWIKYLLRFFRPCMRVLGLSDRAVMIWVAAVVFGLIYGSAVILEEAEKGTLTKEELEPLHNSVGINHSIVEDTALFVALGLSVFWLAIPRLIMAIVVVQAYNAIKYLKNKALHR